MRCARCYSRVPDEATHCPDCNLPRPKSVATSEVKVAETSPAEPMPETAAVQPEQLEPPRPIYAAKFTPAKPSARPQRQSAQPVKHKQSHGNKKRFLVLVGIPLLVSALGAAVYLYVIPILKGEEIEAKSAIVAVNRFRSMPSNEAGLTVDERMKKELEKSRLSGLLRSYSGWIYKPVKGDKTKVVILFSFDQGDTTHRAEWLADLSRNTFTPQDELAAAVFKR